MRSSVLGMRSVLGFVLGYIMCSYPRKKQQKNLQKNYLAIISGSLRFWLNWKEAWRHVGPV